MHKWRRCRITGIQFQEVVIGMGYWAPSLQINQNGKFYDYNSNSLAIHQTNEKKPLKKELKLSIYSVIIQSSSSSRLNPVNSSSRLNTLHTFQLCATAKTPKQIIKTQLYLLSCAHWRPHRQGLKYLQRESKIWSREKSRRKTKRVPTSIHRMKKPRHARCGNAEERALNNGKSSLRSTSAAAMYCSKAFTGQVSRSDRAIVVHAPSRYWSVLDDSKNMDT